MSKANDVDELLGTKAPTKPAAKKAAAKADTAEAKPAKKTAKVKEEVADVTEAKPAKKTAKVKEEAAEPKARAPKAPISFEEGERATIADGVKAHFKKSKKPINSKDLAAKLETETRKLRVVLYTLKNQGVVTLESGESKVAGMTVSPV